MFLLIFYVIEHFFFYELLIKSSTFKFTFVVHVFTRIKCHSANANSRQLGFLSTEG